jgi:hypothetical protein
MITKASKRVESKLILKRWRRICQIRVPEITLVHVLAQAQGSSRSAPR